MRETLTTTQVAELLGVGWWRLERLIRAKKLAPMKDAGNRRQWTKGDVDRARAAIAAIKTGRPPGATKKE